MTIIAATGHRPSKLGGYGATVQNRLIACARTYLQGRTVTKAVSGMALGWDAAWALAALELDIPLIAAVPCDGHDLRWPEASRLQYQEILNKAAQVIIVSPGPYAAWKMQRRNEWMVDHSDRLAALWNGSPGGTANCLAYAKRKEKPIDYLWSVWLRINGGTLDTIDSFKEDV